MVSITGRGKDTIAPELFQVYQYFGDDDIIKYRYQHLELGTHKKLQVIDDINPLTFEFPSSFQDKTIMSLNGPHHYM